LLEASTLARWTLGWGMGRQRRLQHVIIAGEEGATLGGGKRGLA
jgi:hypothetical protein